MPIVEVRKNITIKQTLDNTGQFSKTINIDFLPDEVIVRSVVYYLSAGEALVSTLYSDLVGDHLCPIVSGIIQSPFTSFQLHNKPIKGSYNFTVQTVAGAIDTARAGSLVLVLDFVKYKPYKSEKIY